MSLSIDYVHIDDVSPKRLLTRHMLVQGYKLRELSFAGIPHLEFTAPSGWKWITRKAFIPCPFVGSTAYRVANNKQLSNDFAASQGVAIPKTITLPDESDQLELFVASYAPVIVKPLSGFGSHGLTLNITTFEEAREAVANALQHADKVLVQQEFNGLEARFTVIRGKVVSCIVRESPRVIGDGVSTISQLLKEENKIREALSANTYVPYPQLDESLIDASFFSDTSIPAAGEVIPLGRTSLPNQGASIHDITSKVHNTYKDIAITLGSALNSEFAVVDMLIADYTQPATKDNYVFLEFTLSPSLRLYYDVRSGQDYDILAVLAGMIKEMGERK